MGCFQSKTGHLTSPEQEPLPNPGEEGKGSDLVGEVENLDPSVPSFREFELAELRAATNGFSTDFIISESGEKAPNVVYKGKLKNNSLVAIKRFSRLSWPDPNQFVVLHLFSLLLVFYVIKYIRKYRNGVNADGGFGCWESEA